MSHYTHIFNEYNNKVKSQYPNLPDSEEVAERMGVMEHLSPDAVVLEIGASVGGVSSIIAAKLKNSQNLVAVEPHKETCDGLQQLGARLGTPFHTFAGVVRGDEAPMVNCTGAKNDYVTCVECPNPETENLTVAQIEQRYGLTFDTVVIDCEGCYMNLFPTLLCNLLIKQIQIEWDGRFMEKELFEAGFRLVATYKHIYVANGVRVYNR